MVSRHIQLRHEAVEETGSDFENMELKRRLPREKGPLPPKRFDLAGVPCHRETSNQGVWNNSIIRGEPFGDGSVERYIS